MLESADPSGSPERAERLAAVYTDTYPVLSALATRRFRVPPEDVQGVIHEVFVSYMRHERTIRDSRAWLVGAICKASRKYWHKGERAEAADVSDRADPHPLHDVVTARLDVLLAFRQLGARCREVIRLRFFEGFSAEELANRYSTTVGYAKLMLARCMATTRDLVRGARSKGRA